MKPPSENPAAAESTRGGGVLDWFARTISRKLLAAFFLVFLATYFATALVVQGAVRGAVTQAELRTLDQLAHLKLGNLESRFGAFATNLRAWSKLDVMNDLASGDVDKRVERALEGLKADYSLAGELYAFDAAGRLVASSSPRQGQASLPAIWKAGKELSFIDKHVNPFRNSAAVALSIPVTSAFAANFQLGTLVLAYPWSQVHEALADQAVLIRRQAAPVLLDSTVAAAPAADLPAALAAITADGWVRIGDKRYLANGAQSSGGLLPDWQVIVVKEPTSLSRTLDSVALKLAALCAVLAVPLTLAIRWLARRLSAPLRDLTRVVVGITETGDLSRRVALSSRDETGTLATAFNLMAERLEGAHHDTVTMLSIACEGKDEDTGFHVNRVQHFTAALALEMGLAKEDATHMGLMSILHDVGKLNIPDAILKKPAKLDAEEWAIMQTHAEHGVRILGNSSYYAIAREIAVSHHENWDGSGYPKGLAQEDIPLSGRIVKVADVFDALTSRRPYKEPWPVERAMELLREQAGRQFDPQAVTAFCRLHERGELAEILRAYHG